LGSKEKEQGRAGIIRAAEVVKAVKKKESAVGLCSSLW
jgi:hypothetical protein